MTRAMEHCDDTVMEHCNDKNSGALCGQGPWSIVIKGDKEHCDDMGRELCDDSGLTVL